MQWRLLPQREELLLVWPVLALLAKRHVECPEDLGEHETHLVVCEARFTYQHGLLSSNGELRILLAQAVPRPCGEGVEGIQLVVCKALVFAGQETLWVELIRQGEV